MEHSIAYYETLGQVLEQDLSKVGSLLRDKNSTFSNKSDVLNAATAYYGKESEAFASFKNSFAKISTSNLREANELTDFQQIAANEIIESVYSFSSLEKFKESLDVKFSGYHTMDLAEEDKEFILSFITIYKASLEFLAENPDLFLEQSADGRRLGWWEDWGKCAAGTIGGAGLGALGGAAAGSAVPVLGTTAGGIIGGISGGLSGAAASC